MKGKALIVILVTLAIAMVITTIVFFSVEQDSVETGSVAADVTEQEDPKQDIEFAEDYSFNEELYDMYEDLGYPKASKLPSLFRDVAAAAHANDQFIEIDEIVIDEEDRIFLVTVPLDENNPDICGLYGQAMCMIVRETEDDAFEIIQIMFAAKDRDDDRDDVSNGHWSLGEYHDDENAIVAVDSFGDAGFAAQTGYLIDLKKYKREAIGTYELEGEVSTYTMVVDDTELKVIVTSDQDLNFEVGQQLNIEFLLDGEPRKEENVVLEKPFQDTTVRLDWDETASNPGEIRFFVFDQEYLVTSGGDLIAVQ